MNSAEAAKRILGLDKEATPGPWDISDDDNWPRIIQTAHLTKDVWEIVDSGDHYDTNNGIKNYSDIQLIAESRTLAPQIARRYLEAMELLLEASRWLRAVKESPHLKDMASSIEKFLSEEETK